MKTIPLAVFICLLITEMAYGNMAFVANLDGNWDLFITDENGKNAIQLTRTEYDEKDPNWSFDRKKIVFSNSAGQLMIMDVEKGDAHQIAETELKTPKISPSFSPDGKQIAFARFRLPEEGDDTDLMIHNVETKENRRLIDQYAIQMWPAWSPDGSRIVYANMHCSGECGRLIQELWITAPSEKWSRQLLLTHSFCQQPVWSPDGSKIAFASDQSGNYDVWVVDLKKWELRQITTDDGLDVKPAWSPDGKKMAFVSMRSGIMEIWTKDLVKGTVTMLKPFGDRNIECKDVTW